MDGDSKILTRDEVLIATGDAHAFGDIDLLDKVRNHDAAMRADRAALVALVKDLAKELAEWQSHTADGSCCDVGRLLARARAVQL